MPEMTEREKPGPKPLPPEEKGRKVMLYLRRPALEDLALLAGENGKHSELIARLLRDEVKRMQRKGLL